MTEHDAVQPVLAAPADDGPRFAFADWLDRRGEPGRAEFIRGQCEMAAIERRCDDLSWAGYAAGTGWQQEWDYTRDPRWAALRAREQELRTRYSVRELGGLLPDTTDYRAGFDFRRGFIDTVGATPLSAGRMLARDGARLLHHPVRELILFGPGSAGDYRAIGDRPLADAVPVLRLLVPRQESHTHGIAQMLSRSRWAALRELSIQGVRFADDGASLMAAVGGLRELHRLKLVNCTIGTAALEELATAPRLRGLQELEVSRTAADTYGHGPALGLAELAQSPVLRSVRSLCFQGSQVGTADAVALAESPHLTSLEQLRLNCCMIGRAGIDALNRSTRFPRLKRLSVESQSWRANLTPVADPPSAEAGDVEPAPDDDREVPAEDAGELPAPEAADRDRETVTEHPLLGAVYAAPDDDLPRLVFADWLDEHGHPEQAAYIRVQCETARRLPGDPDLPDLDAQESRARHGWGGPPDTDNGVRYTYRRGFPAAASFAGPDEFFAADERAEWPATFDTLSLGERRDAAWTPADFRRLLRSPLLPRVRDLTISTDYHFWADASEAAAVFGSPALDGLRRLRLSWVGADAAEALTAARLPSLERLQLDAVGGFESHSLDAEPDARTVSLDRVPILGQLRELSLDSVGLDAAALARLFAASRFPRLRSLRLQRVRGLRGDGCRALAAAAWLERLEALHVGTSGLTSDDLRTIAADPKAAGLRTLWLRTNALDCDGVAELARSPAMAGLRRLNLRANRRLADAGVKALAASPLAADLRELNLGFTRFGDGGLKALATSRHLGQLRRLDVSCNEGGYGNDGGTALARSRHLRGLVDLQIDGGRLSDRCWDAVRRRYDRNKGES